MADSHRNAEASRPSGLGNEATCRRWRPRTRPALYNVRPHARADRPWRRDRKTSASPRAHRSLEIEREVGSQQFSCPQPLKQISCRTEAAKFATGKHVNVIDIGITAEERREFRVHHPRDFSMGVRIAQQCHCRKGVDDVAERTRLDDQN